MTDTFAARLRETVARQRSIVCVGLDPDPARFPAELRGLPPNEAVVRFNAAIIAATAPYAAVFKPNFAFYEALGADGWQALAETIAAMPVGVLIIGDAKRGDISSTAAAYATAVFARLGCDAVTVSPYLGGDSVAPFLEYSQQGRGVFILCRTSNPGGADLQNLAVRHEGGDIPLFLKVAHLAREWDEGRGAVGLVVGATYPNELGAVRRIAPDLPILVPGIGIQGGDLEANLELNQSGPILISASRSITYAATGGSLADYAAAAASAARRLRDQCAF
ncbi:MAG: orotidine-5'-phosphate decarboxylase [Candidatus Chloroheliales bacterium]|nr:MAG: orotidine-5'-phosphate decarboxylase [Chloroflexota bacterium]